LRLLLEGIDRQALGRLVDRDVEIVVVDNDPDGTAQGTLQWYGHAGRFGLHAHRQPQRGLSSARNCALASPGVAASELFAFLDDDEIPSEQWLESLADEFSDPLCAIAVGPVEPIFDTPPPQWIVTGGFFRKRCEAGDVHEGYTSNVMMRTAVLKTTGVRFDETLNSIGGEDVVFFRALSEQGFAVRGSPRAVVFETIPATRASLKWMMRRWLRAGATSGRLRNASTSAWHNVVGNLFAGVVRVVAGSVVVAATALMHGRRDFAAVAHSLSTVCRGAGMLLAAFGRPYQEYGSSYRPARTHGGPVE
jgi:cellulose synthase/poly-beta-1,6-N-acetylglucosamine synthase-like glycosyltransferase